jgi:hypothetical protein
LLEYTIYLMPPVTRRSLIAPSADGGSQGADGSRMAAGGSRDQHEHDVEAGTGSPQAPQLQQTPAQATPSMQPQQPLAAAQMYTATPSLTATTCTWSSAQPQAPQAPAAWGASPMQPSTLDMSGAPQGVQPQSGAPPGAQASPMYGGYATPPPGAQWDPRGQQYVYMPQGVIPWSTVNAPAMATAQGAAPTVETIKDVTKGELEALSTELGPSERERWSKKFLLRAKLSVPGVHAVLTMTSEEYASLRAGDEQAIARLRQKYGAFDFLASDEVGEVGARMLYSVIDPKGEHSEAFLHDLEKEPDEVQGSGR